MWRNIWDRNSIERNEPKLELSLVVDDELIQASLIKYVFIKFHFLHEFFLDRKI